MPLFDKLNSNNYNTWNGDMGAWFRAQALWRIVSGVSKLPTVSATPKEGEEDKLERWQLKADKAAGIMWLMVANTQRVYFRGIKDDPVKMWGTLKEVHMQKRAGTHFNTYDDLFSIRKREEEDIQSLINRVDNALHRIRDLQSTAFTLDKLDDELGAMALIRALPEDYNSFVSSLLLKDDVDKAAVQIAFVSKDNQHRRHQEESPAIGTALAASSPALSVARLDTPKTFAGNTRVPRTRLGRIETTGRRTRPTLLRLRKLRLNSLEMQVLPLHLHLPFLLTFIGLQTQGQLLI